MAKFSATFNPSNSNLSSSPSKTTQVKTTEEALSIIQRDLLSLPNAKSNASSIFVLCPFHDDRNTPSCGVNIDSTKSVGIGVFYCFGCNERGTWNKLASKLNLTIIENWTKAFSLRAKSLTETEVDEEIAHILKLIPNDINDIDNLDDSLESMREEYLSNQRVTKSNYPVELTEILQAMRIRNVEVWPKCLDWRSYDGDLLRRLGVYLISDSNYSEDFIRQDALFVVSVHDKIVGAVKGLSAKNKEGLSYITSPGHWVKSHGLMFYDQARNLCLSTNQPSVYIVEGTRDAMRFYKHNRPAIAVLGAESVSFSKVSHMMTLDTRNLVIVPDGDTGGDRFQQAFERALDEYSDVSSIPVNVIYAKIPKSKHKYDPCSMPEKSFLKMLSMFS